jgi:hypothetical protein
MAICQDRSRYAKRLTAEEAAEVREVRRRGWRYQDIMEVFDVSHQTVANIVMGRVHRGAAK